MTWLVRLMKQGWARIIPARAATQTWMILTFVLFIGIAMVAVALYMALVMRGQIEVTMRQTLAQQAHRIALLIEQAPTRQERLRITREIARLTDLHLTILERDTMLLDVLGEQVLSDGAVRSRPEMLAVREEGTVRYEAREGPDGRRIHYVAVARPSSGLIVRVGQPDPPLFSLIERMQVILFVAMGLALLLSILGSWIAARQITRPLIAIRNSARSISEGKFDEKIQVDSRAAEFQDLAKSLNRMSDSFREKIEELQRLARLQNEFIGNVSHEVRNPIFAVGGYLEALASSNLTPEQRTFYAEKGLANLQRLNNLFNDLIEIARLEYREDLIKPSVFNLQDLIEEVAETLASKAQAKGLTLEVDNPPVLVHADRARIQQVLTNLIDNAIAYSDEGTVRCRVRRHLDKVRVEVVDTGKGIGEEHLERIFERFYRVDPDRSRKSGGTGLGLSIVKQILHAHGESIHVESTLGRGTRFWFTLPFAGEPEAVEPSTAS
ncbi:MAG: two-component sensor histidine kinase [Rhodothermaceae bacterium]|nr:MAG: two-component sensor histidine kinase [Rhodothermaceae bacterium]